MNNISFMKKRLNFVYLSTKVENPLGLSSIRNKQARRNYSYKLTNFKNSLMRFSGDTFQQLFFPKIQKN